MRTVEMLKPGQKGTKDLLTETKSCRACGNEIPSAALKCTECSSFQNWRRYLAFSSTILTLLIALFSVLTVALPVITKSLKRPQADIAVAAIAVDHASMTLEHYLNLVGLRRSDGDPALQGLHVILSLQLLATNSGDSAGTITHIEVDGLKFWSPFSDEKSGPIVLRLLDSENQKGAVLVGPNESRLFWGYAGPYRTYGPLEEIHLKATVVASGNQVVESTFTQDAPRLQLGNAP